MLDVASDEDLAGFHAGIRTGPLTNGLTVVTGNVRHFARVPGLLVEDWL